jgi:hypothetical protein
LKLVGLPLTEKFTGIVAESGADIGQISQKCRATGEIKKAEINTG